MDIVPRTIYFPFVENGEPAVATQQQTTTVTTTTVTKTAASAAKAGSASTTDYAHSEGLGRSVKPAIRIFE
ncbi:hypothetical protein OESDEN_10173 [Oesophagostomum dentatum]|uniref:Uncharacterized protein n=1 Tax=Oesophagostomum dentatum TaxID=61180 RepID=A0A0B1T3L0_OESDE|nr:hypothetical protein OESDEN_10173 [Oesophagostomum dentatum]